MTQPSEHRVHLEKKSLKRSLGAWDLFAVGYGDVGSSLYYSLGLIALYALGAAPVALLLAGLVFICTCLTYAEMSTTFPEPGGSATFSRYAFNDLVSFIAGWGLLLDYILTLAISAFAIIPYIQFLLPFPYSVFSHLMMTIGLIAFLFVINWIGVIYSGHFSVFLAFISGISQLLLIAGALIMMIQFPYLFEQFRVNIARPDWAPNMGDFIKGTAMAMVAYTGIESIAQLAAETRKPAIAIPKAIKRTMVFLVFLYVGMSIVGLSAVTPKELGTTYVNNPIIGVVEHLPFGGHFLGIWFSAIAALLLLIGSNAGLIGCSRLVFSMAEYYQVPHFFYRLHPKFRTPTTALAFFACLASIVVLLSRGSLAFLADLYNFGAQIAFFFAHLSLLVLRWKKPTFNRPYLAPLNIPVGKGRRFPLTAMLGLVGSLAIWIIVIVTKPEGRYLGLLWLAGGIVMYLFYRRKKELTAMGQLSIEKIKVPEYHPMHLKHLLVTARLVGNTEAMQTACQLAKGFSAKITAVHIIEVPPALPMHAPMLKREEQAEAALKRAEAVAREYDLSIELKLVRARSTEEALLDLVSHGDYDMVVVGARKEDLKKRDRFALGAEQLLKQAPCRVIFCKS